MNVSFLRNTKLILFVLVVVGLVMRLIPIRYGLPLQLNIDEPSLVSAVFSLKSGLNPGRFDWPHLYFYINFLFYGLFYWIFKIVGLATENDSYYFMISRGLSAVFGVATIPVVYLITKELFGGFRKPILAAVILTILPVHVYESFFAKLDVAHTFFISLAVLFMAKLMNKASMKNYILSGLFIGLSVSVKYNAFLLALPFMIAHYYAFPNWRYLLKPRNILKPIVAALVSIVAFFVGTPFAILDFKTFWSYEPRVGALWQFTNVGNIEWTEYAESAYETFITMYRGDLGIVIWVVFILMLISYLFFCRRDRRLNFLLLPVIIISFYISKLERSPAHYFVFLSVLYVPALSDFIISAIDRFRSFKFSPVILKVVSIFLVGLILIPSIYSSIKSVYLYSQIDTRLEAYNWVQENIIPTKRFIYVAGNELTSVIFEEKESLRVKRVDVDVIDKELPVYLILGYNFLTLDALKASNWDIDNVGGSSEDLLPQSEMVKYIDNQNRPGPPIIIFKISDLTNPNAK